MKIMRDIQTVSQFKQNASKLVKQIQQTKHPLILTVNGKAAVVLQDVETYQASAARREYDLTVAAIKEALADFDDRENWSTHEEVFAELRENNRIK
jgi:prevent-host-death family protein